MSGNRWGKEGPPSEAYSRITNPERFQPLHDFTVGLLSRLEATFDVERLEGNGLDLEIEKNDLARPSVKLLPQNSESAPIIVAFTAYPGLHVRFGRWRKEGFPACGCDACDETSDGEIARLSEMVDNVTAGRFREAILLPPVGDALQESAFWSPKGERSSRSRLDRTLALEMLSESVHSSFDWKPWPRSENAIASDAV